MQLSLVLDRFDRAWQSGLPPNIDEFLPSGTDEATTSERRRLLVELVMVDLELRWKRAETQLLEFPTTRPDDLPNRPYLEDYARRFRALGPVESLPVELIGQEYRVRRAHGDCPGHESYLSRFASLAVDLRRELSRIDEELTTDTTLPMAQARLGGGEAENSTLAPSPRPSGGPALTRSFGDYELLHEIARGGMGVVFKARQVRLNRIVALKMILAGQFANREEVRRFQAEAEAAANLDHPGIVPIYEIGERDGQHYFSMAYVEGQSLAELIRHSPLSASHAAGLVMRIAEAMAHAHGKGVIHRDLKPGNVLLDATGQPKVTDFGLAKRVGGDGELTASGQVLGTPSYMPPEQAAGRIKEVSQAADVYALGAILYCALTGRPPFQTASLAETLEQVLHAEPVAPRALVPTLPRDLETICLKSLQKLVANRYATAAELAADLGRFLRGEPIVARRVGRVERTWRWLRRRPLVAALGVSLVAVAFLSAGALVVGRQARQARQQVDFANELAAVQKEFDTQVDHPELGADYLLTVAELVNELQRRDPVKAQAARERFIRHHADYITDVIHRPRLTDEEGQAVRETLVQFERFDAAVAAELLTDLERNWRQWTELFQLKPPYSQIEEVFAPDVLTVESGRLIAVPRPVEVGRALFLMSKQKSAGDFELDAVYRGPWRRAPKILLAIDADAVNNSGQTGYLFIVHPGVTDDALERSKDGGLRFEVASSVVLEIRSGKTTLRRRIIRSSELGSADEFRLHVARKDRQLTMQVNDLAPLEAEEMFRIVPVAGGVFSIVDPRGPRLPEFILSELSVRSRRTSESASPLAQGDAAFTRSDFAAALEDFRLQVRTSKEAEFRNEARFKEALSLCALKRESEALPIFADLFTANDPRWSPRAACQLWLLNLEAGKWPEADAVMATLSATHKYEELAAVVPTETLDRIMAKVIEHVRRSETDTRLLIAQLERLVSSLDVLGAVENRLYGAKLDLLTAYELVGDSRKVYALARQLVVAKGGPTVRSVHDVPWDYARLALEFGEGAEALRVLESLIVDPSSGEPRVERAAILLARATIHAAQEDWDQTVEEITSIRKLRDKAREVGGATWNSFLEVELESSLLLGRVHERRGDLAAAHEEWRSGFQLARAHSFPDQNCWTSGMLGSLSGELTAADVEVMVDRLSKGIPVALGAVVRNRLVPIEFLTSVTKNVWQTPLGRSALDERLWGAGLAREAQHAMDVAMFHEIGRQMLLGPQHLAEELSANQHALLAQIVRDVLEANRTRQFAETHGVQTLLALSGNTGVFGWGGLAPRLPPEIRGPGAFMFACYFWHRSDQRTARIFLESALKEAPSEGPLRELAEELQQKFGEP